jgi:hypothetical protein
MGKINKEGKVQSWGLEGILEKMGGIQSKYLHNDKLWCNRSSFSLNEKKKAGWE